MLKTYLITDENNSLVSNSTIIKPIMGNQLSAKEYFSHALPWYNQTGKLSSPSEVGCTLTHIEIYKKIISSNQPGLIFESDIKPSNEEISNLSSVLTNKEIDFLHLGWHPLINFGIFFKGKYIKDYNLYKINPNINFHGTYAYYISVKAAKELLSFQNKMLKPADSWAIFFNQSDITPFFYPLFTHPFERGGIHRQRMSVSTRVLALTKKNIFFYIRKLFIKITSKFRLYRNITPDDFAKKINLNKSKC